MLHFRPASNGPAGQCRWLPRWMYAQVPFNERRIAWSMLGCTILAAGLWGLGPASMEDIACGVTIILFILITMWGTLWVDEQAVIRSSWAMLLLLMLFVMPWVVLIHLMKFYGSENHADAFLAAIFPLGKITLVLMPLMFVPLIHLTIHGWLRLLFRPRSA